MDHYFLAPQAPVAVPRAYWLNGDGASIKGQILGSHVMLIEPNEGNYRRILDEALSSGDFDMEVLNHLFSDSAMILPRRRLALLSGEFRATDHRRYLSEDKDVVWNAHAELSRAYLVHFSDWPLPKPWKRRDEEMWQSMLPPCREHGTETANETRCADRVLWSSFYENYDYGQTNVCEVLSLAPFKNRSPDKHLKGGAISM
ncbi:N-acetylglucosaminyltransferase [Penicillium capsulatum]|uniref:N-acetylglucosaminyltransferase n=1 Tax=Penicillium capsulatum TaxID=69766 RepID=A0A9W9HZB9_9EURO|nr:N-acetylglucosaminyltransferase [Penicillium capsulatum]KAJ6117049.1 N-acetylglucosaminyltransferase [Penicillium capsulatum]